MLMSRTTRAEGASRGCAYEAETVRVQIAEAKQGCVTFDRAGAMKVMLGVLGHAGELSLTSINS